MPITRRQLLSSSALSAGTVLVPSRAAGAARGARALRRGRTLVKKFRDPLTWPAYVDGTKPVSVTLANARHRFHSSLPRTDTLAYRLTSGTVLGEGPRPLRGYLGPTIVVPTGSGTRLTATNAITHHPCADAVDLALHGARRRDRVHPRTAVHLHGGNTSPDNDGGPLDTFLDTKTYSYPNTQDATQLWYHDHALSITRLNVYAGLAGGYLIRDTSATGIDTGDGLHLPAPPYEIPLVLQDRTFTPDGALAYPPAPWEPEFFGNTAVVNGTAFPYLEVARGVYRFRLVNGSNARFYRLTFSEETSGRDMPFLQIGSDGGLFNTPVPMAHLLISPGERADLLVDFRRLHQGSRVNLTNNAVAPFPNGEHSEQQGGAPLRQIMQFQVTAATGWRPRRPMAGMSLRPVTPVTRLDSAARNARVRTSSLVELADEDDEVLMGTLNNRTFHNDDFADHPVRPHALEVWEFANTTMDSHPLHLHLVQFQMLNRQPFDAEGYLSRFYADDDRIVPDTGAHPAPDPTAFLTGPAQPPAANERGWKDTVHSPPGMVTRIAVPFGSGAVTSPIAARRVYSGDYVWHCHILEHEDNDMMQRYRISG